MSVRVKQTVAAFIAGADLSSSQHTFVKLGTNANEVVQAGAGEAIIGILSNCPAQNETADVVVAGGAYLKIADGTSSINDIMKSDASGKGTVTTTVTDLKGARVLQASSAADSVVEVLIETGSVG